MIPEISGVAAGVKAALDIVKGLKDLKQDADIQSAIAELTGALADAQREALDAYEQQRTLLDHVQELEAKISASEKWDAEAERYELANIGQGVVAFVLKEEAGSDEISHKLCPDCFEQRTKSYLQVEGRDVGRAKVAVCNRCGLEGYVFGHRHAQHGPSRRRR